ncbi:hypothetical protein MAPG_09848 [Magnaporthiopsis poae ATCC 64411]|uniref:Uncharacterized protein n=1 Tax=Magnaporthiopsis poae (strain ATCC 64411 / 73-15) TaxID=644358 RepID=A0A0C4EB08_MAGP6|nr:hypothetical protein MAPG_09848 [Magnaporthiopsis poae ATCC 64411]
MTTWLLAFRRGAGRCLSLAVPGPRWQILPVSPRWWLCCAKSVCHYPFFLPYPAFFASPKPRVPAQGRRFRSAKLPPALSCQLEQRPLATVTTAGPVSIAASATTHAAVHPVTLASLRSEVKNTPRTNSAPLPARLQISTLF